MNAVVGILLLAGAILLFGWAYVQYRRPKPASWTTWELSEQFIVITCMTFLGFGLGLLGRFMVRFEYQAFGLFEAGLIAAIAVVAVLLIGLLKASWKRLSADDTSGGLAAVIVLPTNAGDDSGLPPQTRSPNERGRTPARKAA